MRLRATIADLQGWIENPGPDANVIINGRTPHDRAKDLLKQAERRRREQQLSRYTQARESDAALVKNLTEVLDELEDAVGDMRKGLKRGTQNPQDVMGVVAESMRGLQATRDDALGIDNMAEVAAEHIDKSPAEFEQEQLDRFPNMPITWASVAYLRGEEPSPFDEGGE